jgi:hypothetical protein
MPGTKLIDQDGNVYTAPSDEQAQAALQSGHFSLAPLDAPVPSNPPTELKAPPEPVPVPKKKQQTKFTDNFNVPLDKTDAGNDEELPVVEMEKPLPAGQEKYFVNLKDKEGREVPVSEDQADRLVASGTHTVEDVPLIDNEGNFYDSPDPEKTQAALQSGEFRLSTLAERRYQEAQKEEQAAIEEGGGTGLKPYIGGTADAVLTGINEHNPVAGIGFALADAIGGTNVRAEKEKIADIVKAEHPGAYYSGGVGGEVGSALGLGSVAGGISKGLALSGATKLATEGAVYSTDSVVNNLVDKDPAGAAEALALGVGMNFGLHGVFSAVGAIPKAVGEAGQDISDRIGGSAPIEKEPAENLVGKQILGLTPAQIAKLREKIDIGPALKAVGITADDIVSGKAGEKLQGLETAGPKIGAAIQELDELFPSEKKPIIEQHLGKAAEEINEMMPQEVKNMKRISDRLNQLFKIEHPDDLPIAARAEKELTEYTQKMEEYLEWRDNPNRPEKPERPVEENKEVSNETPTVNPDAEAAPTVKPPAAVLRDQIIDESKLPPKPKALLDYEKDLNEHEAAYYEGAEKERLGEKVKEKMEFSRPERPETPEVQAYDEEVAKLRKAPRALKAGEFNERPKLTMEEWAKKQGEYYDYSQANPGAPRLPRSFADYLEAEGKHSAAGAEIEKLTKELENMEHLPPDAVQAQKAIRPILDQLQATSKRGTFNATQQLKRWVAEQVNWGADNKFVNSLRRRASGIVAANLRNAEDEAVLKGGLSPTVNEGLKTDRLAYALHDMIGDAIDKLDAKDIPKSLLEKLAGATRHERSLPILALHLLGVPPPLAVAAGLALPFTKKYLAQQTLKKAAQKLLGESSTPETFTLLHAMQQQEIKINDGVKNTLSALASSKASKVVPFPKDAIAQFIPDAKGLSHKEQLSVLHDAIVSNASNPGAIGTHLGNITSGLRAEGLNKVADEYTDHQLRLMKVLQSILPADPSMKNAHPFSTKVVVDEIEPATKEKYNRALSIAADPTVLLERIKSNDITAGDVAIAAAVNPSTLQKMRDALVQEAIKSKPNLSYQQHLSMEILMGTNIDESSEQLPVLQGTYAPVAGLPAKGKGKGKGAAPKPLSIKSANNLQDQYLTQSEKVLGH